MTKVTVWNLSANLFVFILCSFAYPAAIVYGGLEYPFQRQVTIDGSITITNEPQAGYIVDGVWHALVSPALSKGTAVAISGNGSVISGDIQFSDYPSPTAGLWIRNEPWGEIPTYSFQLLPLLDGFEGGGASNLSENGKHIIGGSFTQTVAYKASYWDENYRVFDLGSIFAPSVRFASETCSVSNSGVVVGSIINEDEHFQLAYIWDKTNGMRYLKDVLEHDYGFDFSGSVLADAYNISPNGSILSGLGYDSQDKGFYWEVTIPEPASLLILGLGGLWLRRRHCQ
jgi:hypothetical protein